MARKKWFRRTPKHEKSAENTFKSSAQHDSLKVSNEHAPDHNTSLEYHETLYSSDSATKSQAAQNRGECWQRKHWEPSSAIADNVDSLHQQTEKRTEKITVYNIEQKVDSILQRKRSHRKQVKNTNKTKKVTPEGYLRVHHKKTGLEYYKKKI